MQKILWSRNPDSFEIEVMKDYLKELMQKNLPVDKMFFYIDLDTEQGIEVVTYPTSSINFLSDELDCTPMEALQCYVNYPGFLSDLKEIMYWNDIGEYKKFNVTTMSHNKREEKVYHTNTIFSTSKEHAASELRSQGFEVTEVIDVDE